MRKKVVILLSGGLDSSTVLALISQQNYDIYGLSFNYSQNNILEIQRIKRFIQDYKLVNHQVINLDLSSFRTSSLVNKEIGVPKYADAKELGDEIPTTYVPARNTIFLSYALGYAEVVGAKDIFIGTHNTDAANYPDCRPEYIKAFEKMANLATKAGVIDAGVIDGGIRIHAPFIDMSKAEIVKTGLDLGVNYANTLSCYDPSPEAESCGECHACRVRIEAFLNNKMQDPVAYCKDSIGCD